MNSNVDPLAGLKDIHLPSEIGWWPPAPGWWLVAVFVAVLLYFLGGRAAVFLKNRRFRREARAELGKIFTDFTATGNGVRFFTEVSVLLRRLAIHRYGRTAVADLTGASWLEFLDRTGNTKEFTAGSGCVLGEALYSGKVESDPEKVFRVAEHWIRVHT